MSLIHWWPLNGNLKDYGTLNSTLTNINSTATNNSGKIGKCYYFNGSNNALRAEYPNTTKPTSALSLAGWYKPDSGSSQHYIVNCYESGGAGLAGQDTIKFQIYSSGAYSSVSTSIPDTNWHHWCGTFDGRYLKLYMDGVLKATTDLGSGTHTITYHSTTCWMIGANPYNDSPAGNYTKGYINDVRIYDKALSQKEVKEISKGLVLHYTFEDAYAEGTTNKYAYTGTNPRWSSTFYDGASGKYNYGDESNGQYEFVTTADKNGNLKKMVKVSLRTARTTSPYIFIDEVLPSLNGYVTVSFDYFATCGTQTIYSYSYRGNYRASRWDESTHQWIGGTSKEIDIPVTPNKWNHIIYRFTRLDDTYTSGPGYVRVGSSSSTSDYWLFDNIQVEVKDHATPYVNGTRPTGLIYDSSGYGHNAEKINDEAYIIDGGPSGLRYFHSSTGATPYSITPKNVYSGTNFSFSMWLRFYNGTSTVNQWVGRICNIEGNGFFNFGINGGANTIQFGYFYNNNLYQCTTSFNSTDWTYWVGTFDGTTGRLYKNGVLVSSNTAGGYSTSYDIVSVIGGSTMTGGYRDVKCDIADFKLFSTTLSVDDILAEYQTKASIDRSGNLFTDEFVETNNNLLELANYKIATQGSFDGYLGASTAKKTYYDANYPNKNSAGIGKYTQSNLSVTMTENGARIYSAPNLVYPDDGSTMWGGLGFSPMKNSNCLIKGHRYIISWHVSGQSSRAMSDVYWTNQIGWGQSPDASPTINASKLPPANFQGEMDCYYDFTINDEVWKTTGETTHSGFDPNTTYLAYAGFKIGYTYASTGTLGTDVYITNLQMIDVTDNILYKITKNGLVKTTQLNTGNTTIAKVKKNGNAKVNDAYEL